MRLPLWRYHQQAELEEEIRSHLDMAVRERVERGEDPQEAAQSARRQFGNTLLVQEIARDMWGWTSLEQLLQDVRYGLRLMAKEPGFTAVAVLTLAIGIGANTAVFSLVNALVLRPFYPDIQHLIVVGDVPDAMHGRNLTYRMSYPKYQAWRQHHEIFESLGALYAQGPSLTGLGEPERIQAAFVSSELLPTLGISPVIGRGFRPEDEPSNAPPVVLLSYQFWRTHFARQKDILGHTLRLNDELFTIVGVLPEQVALGSSLFRSTSAISFDVVAPLRATEMGATFNYLVVFGKIRPQLSVAAATAAIDSQTPTVNQQFASDNKTQVIPLETYLMGDTRPLLFILLGAVGVVLLITCANTANLLLACGAARQKEIAVRLALGARSLRIFRQLLTESLLMSLLGGTLALLLFWGARQSLLNLLADRLPNGIAIPIDSSVLLSTLGLSLVTGLSFGVAPGLQARKRNLRDALGQQATPASNASEQATSATTRMLRTRCDPADRNVRPP